MTPFLILDAGSLIALLDKNDPFHEWVESELRKYFPVLLTCESVLSEASFMLEKRNRGRESLLTFLRESPINVLPTYDGRSGTILDLLDRYSDVPMSFADACLVRLSELYPDAPILTLDSDFLVYRRNKNEMLPVIIPPERLLR